MEKPVELSLVEFESAYIHPDGTKPQFTTMLGRASSAKREAGQWQNGWRIQLFPTYVRLTHPDTWDHFIPLSRVSVALGK